MTIRQATKSDIALIKSIKPQISDSDIANRLNKQTNREATFLVLEDNGGLYSFVLLKWRGKNSHPDYPDMEDLFTKEDQRGKGYGTKLISECERLTKERGFNKIGLAVNPIENKYAKDLYEHLGYIHDGKPSYVDGVYDGVEDWVIDLEKNLSTPPSALK